MSIYYPAGKNSDQPLVDCKNYVVNKISQYNVNELLNTVRPPLLEEYYSLNYAQVYHKGHSYPDSTTLSIQSPSITDGSQALCHASFGLSIYSLNISGSNNQSGDVYHIYPSNNASDINNFAVIRIVIVDSGYVKTYEVLESGSNFTNSSSIVCYKNSKSTADEDGYFGIDDMELSNNVSLIYDKFSISKIIIDSEGSGYSRYDNSSKTIEYKITTNNSGSGIGFYATLKSKNYYTLEPIDIIKTKSRNRDRNRSSYKNKYGETIIQASSVSPKKVVFDKVLYSPIKTQVLSSQQYLTYSFDKEKNEWVSLETTIDPSSEDKCSTFRDGFTYATLGLAASFGDFDTDPKCQIFDLSGPNRQTITKIIRESMERVINNKKIVEIFRASFPNAEHSIDLFDRRVIRGIGSTIAEDIKKRLPNGFDYKALGFCSLKEIDDFITKTVAEQLNNPAMRARFSQTMLELIRSTLRPGESIFGFNYPLNNYNLEDVRKEIERRLYRPGGVWQGIISRVSGTVGQGLGYSNGWGNLIVDPYEKPPKPIKPIKPKVKTLLLKALLEKIKSLQLPKAGTFKVKCVNGKTVLKGVGKALKILAVYMALQELAQAQNVSDVGEAVANFVSPLPLDWFKEGGLEVINLNNIPQQDITELENQIIRIIVRYTLYPNPEAMRVDLNTILENFVPRTVNLFGEPVTEGEVNQILQNIIDDAENIRNQLGDDAALEDLNINIEELKRQIDFYEAANRNMEQAFIDAFGSDDICACPGNFEEKQQEFNEKAQQIIDEYNQYHENMRQNGPMTEEEWEQMQKRFFEGSPFSLFENGPPRISMMNMPLEDSGEPVLPTPKNPSNEKAFNGLDMYLIR